MNQLLVLLILSFLCVCFIYFLLWSLLFPSTTLACVLYLVSLCETLDCLFGIFFFLKYVFPYELLLLLLIGTVLLCFHFHFSQYIFYFLFDLIFSLINWLFNKMLVSLHVYLTLFRRELNCLATKVLKVVSITKAFVGTLNPRVAVVLH